MNYYRITLTDGTYHYLTGSTARSVRRRFTRDYPHLGDVASVQRKL